jgi:hypothetical protein
MNIINVVGQLTQHATKRWQPRTAQGAEERAFHVRNSEIV